MASVAPLWAGRYLPIADLPQHVAAIATLRHWWDPSWHAQQYFTLDVVGGASVLYYATGAVLAVAFPTAERAHLVLLSSIALALPYALRSLLRALQADERLALFAPAVFYSQPVLIGLLPYVAGLPLLLWTLGQVVRDAERPTARRTALVAAAALALLALHLSAFLLFAPAAVLASLAFARRTPRDIARRLLWAIPALAAGVVVVAASPLTHPGRVGGNEPMRVVFEAPGDAVAKLPGALLDVWPRHEGVVVLLVLATAVVLLALPSGEGAVRDVARPRATIAAAWVAMAGAFYFALPISIGWLWQLSGRYAMAWALLLPCLLRPAPGFRGHAPLLLVAGASLASAGVAAGHIRAFTAEVDGFDHVIGAAQPGKRLLALIQDPTSHQARFPPYVHFGSYYRARKGGVAAFSFAELPHAPLRYRPETAPPVMPVHWEWEPWRFSNEREGSYFDYILVRGTVDPLASAPAGPAWQPIAHQGLWTLQVRKGTPSSPADAPR